MILTFTQLMPDTDPDLTEHVRAKLARLDTLPLPESSGDFSLGRIKVEPTEVEEDVRFETVLVPIAKGLFDEALDGVV